MLVFLLVRLIDGHLTLGTLASFGMLRSMVSGPVNSLMSFIMSSIEISASAERVMSMYELPRDRTQVPEAVKAFEDKAKTDGMGLKIENLAFAYEKGETVLHDVNIDVLPGETVAFVGPSGEGKTTLIRLALGLLTPDEGYACLMTGKGETLDLSVETREFFSYVPQGNTMFSGTIRENMLMGDPNASDEQIIAVLKQACIWNFVQSLPRGWIRKSASAASACRRARRSAWRLRAPCCAARPSCCWTRRPARWISTRKKKCWTIFSSTARAEPAC